MKANVFNVFSHGGQNSAQAFGTLTPGTADLRATSNGEDVDLSAILNVTLANDSGDTFTHNLVPGSPAVDFAPSAACEGNLDQ